MFVVPRSNLAYLNTQEKLQKPAFYILLGEDEATKPQAYIGETENFRERVKDHDSKKSFWQKAHVFVSKGFYSSNGFTVLKGSIIAQTMVPSFNWKEKREGLLQEYTAIDGDKLVMTSDKTFTSPSTAADFCIGSSNNGWLVWKDKDGNTLDSVYRKQLE